MKNNSLTGRLLLTAFLLFPVQADAYTFFAGVGNDGYITDVRGMYDALAGLPALGGLSDAYIHQNLDGPALFASITGMAPIIHPGDTLVWFYSGHGGWQYDGADHDETAGGSLALDGYDETIKLSYGASPVTDDRLAQAFLDLALTGATLITIFDACYAGGFVGGTHDLNSVAGLVFFGSSSELEDSYSYGEASYSIFTQGLINGLSAGAADRNGDSLIMAGEWFDYAYDYTVASVDGQHPVFYGNDVLISAISAVPLPGTLWLLGSAIVGLGLVKKRKLSGTGPI